MDLVSYLLAVSYAKKHSGGGGGDVSWNNVKNKPFKTIGEGLNVDSTGALKADAIYEELNNKADNMVYDQTEHTLQLLSYGVPVGDKIVIEAGGGSGIKEFKIEGKNLVVYYEDGRSETIGKVVGDDGKVYVPHIDDHKVLTFTIEDMAGEIPDPTDLNPFDEWKPIGEEGKTDFVWETM